MNKGHGHPTGGHRKKRKISLKLLENDGALLSNKWLNWIKVLVCQTEHVIQNHSNFYPLT